MIKQIASKINDLVKISKQAGSEILKVYKTDFTVESKADESPLTQADKASHETIISGLTKLFPNIPVISEEHKNEDYNIRKNWKYTWCVDPLDGTKEFVKKNGEFTVNIALLKYGEPVFGIVHVPVQDKTYVALKGQGCRLLEDGQEHKLSVTQNQNGKLRVVGSRSHNSPEVDAFVAEISDRYEDVEFVAVGSTLKFCLIAEGKADIYPRLGPTMEWDTAAGQIVAEEAGAKVYRYEDGERMQYNKENLLNPFFIVSALHQA